MRGETEKGRSIRLLRVAESIRHAIAAILQRGDIRDDALKGISITVTGAEVSPDLRNARVFVSPLGGFHQEEVVKALNRHTAYIRGQMGKAVRLKYLPKLTFCLDTSFDEAGRIEDLLASERVRKDLKNKGQEET